jgi:hypothetical protein
VDTAGCLLQGDVRTKVKTLSIGKIMVEKAVQTSTRRGCANSIISQSRVHAWSPRKYKEEQCGYVENTDEMTETNSNMSIIPINVNGLNSHV